MADTPRARTAAPGALRTLADSAEHPHPLSNAATQAAAPARNLAAAVAADGGLPDRLEAASGVLADLANLASLVVALLDEADAMAPDRACAAVEGARALTQRIGATADLAAKALGWAPCRAGAGAWMIPAAVAERLQRMQGEGGACAVEGGAA